MHYIVDGYNLFFKIKTETEPFEKERKHFIAALDYEIATLHLKVTIVFDSKELFPSKKEFDALEIIFSPEDLSADEYILETLRFHPHPKQTVIVTDDRELLRKVCFLGAKTKTIEEFLRFLTKKRGQRKKNLSSEDKKLLQESDKNIRRLLTIFEKRLDDQISGL
jgi:predicted RNA-binding protein with PIN domain